MAVGNGSRNMPKTSTTQGRSNCRVPDLPATNQCPIIDPTLSNGSSQTLQNKAGTVTTATLTRESTILNNGLMTPDDDVPNADSTLFLPSQQNPSSRQQLAALLTAKKTRKRKARVLTDGAEDGESSGDVLELSRETEEEKLRELDRAIRWLTFLYFTNDFRLKTLREVYGSNLRTDSTIAVKAKAKLDGNVKAFKYQVLDRMKVCLKLYCCTVCYLR